MDVIIVASLMILALAVIWLSLLFWRRLQQQQQSLTELEKQLSQANSQHQQQLDYYESTLERVVQQLNEIHSGALGMGTTVKKLVRQMAVTEERQSQLETEEPETKMYQQAVRLAQQGASVEVIIQDCGLPQGEAELLISLHSK